MCEICVFFRFFSIVYKSGSCSNITYIHTYIHSTLLLCLVVLAPYALIGATNENKLKYKIIYNTFLEIT